MGCTWRGSPGLASGGLVSEADMATVLAAAGDVFTDVTVIYGSAR